MFDANWLMIHWEYKEVDAMQARLNKMEAEMASLRNMQAAVNDEPVKENGSEDKPATSNPDGEGMQTDDSPETIDSRSVYVGNVRAISPILLL